MSSYYIKYDTTAEASKQKALKDCKEWLGAKEYKRITTLLSNTDPRASRQVLLIGLSLNGIQGYPAEVMVDKYLGTAIITQ